MLWVRTPPSTLCPSDIARAVGGDTWRDLMTDVRSVALELRGNGVLEIVQGGEAVADPAAVRGPIRYRRVEGVPE